MVSIGCSLINSHCVGRLACILLVVLSSAIWTLARANSGTPELKQSTARGMEDTIVNQVRRSNSLHNLERAALDLIEQMNSLDNERRHVKYLVHEQDSYDFNARLSTVDILYRSKFDFKLYNVTGRDGYVTQLVRIINPLVNVQDRKPQPVVLYAGQATSVTVFLMASLNSHQPAHWPVDEDWPGQTNGANRSLAITLANNGHDVWLVPARGSDSLNKRRAKGAENKTNKVQGSMQSGALTLFDKLKLDSRFRGLFEALEKFEKMPHLLPLDQISEHFGFWSFSHDEIIEFEFGAQLERVLAETKQPRVSLVTYSNGGFIAHAFAALQPEFARKHIDLMVSLAPAVFVNKFNLALATAGWLSLHSLPNSALIDENLDALARGLWHQVCRSKVVRYTACKTALNLLYGFSDQFQTHFELNLLDYTGLPQSANGFRQTLQCAYAGRLQRYDWGPIGNLIRYGNLIPPSYELQQVKLERSYVFVGERDAVVDQWSVSMLLEQCGRTAKDAIVIPGYNHLDMVAAHDVADLVNIPVLKLLDDRDLELNHYREEDDYKEHHQEHQHHDKHKQQATAPPVYQSPVTTPSGMTIVGQEASIADPTSGTIGAGKTTRAHASDSTTSELDSDEPVSVRAGDSSEEVSSAGGHSAYEELDDQHELADGDEASVGARALRAPRPSKKLVGALSAGRKLSSVAATGNNGHGAAPSSGSGSILSNKFEVQTK